MAAWEGVPEPNTKMIPLGHGQFAKVDSDMYDFLNQWNWRANAFGYAMRMIGRTAIWMHRVVLGCEPGSFTDHVNRDRLDNRRENLRRATPSQNGANKPKPKNCKWSQFKGVHKVKHRWHARGGNGQHIGAFGSEIEAARAYNQWAVKYYGEFAFLNPI